MNLKIISNQLATVYFNIHHRLYITLFDQSVMLSLSSESMLICQLPVSDKQMNQ
jgi:hypothetical protein